MAAALLVAGTAVGGVGWWTAARAVEDTLRDEYSRVARSIAARLNELVHDRSSFVEQVAEASRSGIPPRDVPALESPAPADSANARLDRFRRGRPDVRLLSVYTLDGATVADADGRHGFCPAQHRILLNAAAKAADMGTVDDSGGGLNTAAAPVRNAADETVGVVVAAFASDAVDALLSVTASLGPTTRVVIGRREGDRIMILAASPAAARPTLPEQLAADLPEAVLIQRAVAGERGFESDGLAPGGDRVVAAYQPVDRGALGVLVTRDRDQAFAALRPLRWVFVASAAGMVMIFGVLAGWLVRSVSRPLHEKPAEALPEGERRMRTLIDAIDQSGDMVAITDTGGVVQYINPVFTEATGYRREDIVGRVAPELSLASGDDMGYTDAWATALGGRAWHGSLTCRTKTGEALEVEGTISPVTDAHGSVTHVVAVTHDVGEQRQQETRMQLSQRLDVAGAIAGNFAHDFNNLLTVILCNLVHVLERLPEEDDGLRSFLVEAERATEEASDLVHGLQVFSSRPQTQWRNHPIADVINGAMRLLRHAIHPAVTVRLDVSDDLPMVHTDPARLHHAIANLCLNANDAMPDGGGLTVRAHVETRRPETDDPDPPGEPVDVVCISVQDRGPGMSPDDADRILKLLPSPSVDATTLARLAIARGIVRDHRGWVAMHSRPGEGTRVDVLLPVAPETPEATAPPDASRLRGQGTVLVVDKAQMIGALLRTTLEGKGYRALTACDEGTAMKTLSRSRHRIDAAIVDSDLFTSARGPELVDRLRTACPQLRILVTGGSDPANLDDAGLGREGVTYLSKPFTPADVLLSLKALTTDITSR
jgi:PAS domain S-box-containing protein